MILWSIKLLSSLRKAIAGRRQPGQLAWAIAFGLCLGLIPHGNLVAVTLLVVVLSLQINHAMAALVAVGVSLAAHRVDPISDRVGIQVLSEPKVIDFLTNAWDWPLVAWTDLNNTVVMGSLLIGLTSLLPVVALTYPFLKWWADRADRLALAAEGTPARVPLGTTEESRAFVDPAHLGDERKPHRRNPASFTKPRGDASRADASGGSAAAAGVLDVRRVDAAHTSTSDIIDGNPGDPKRSTSRAEQASRAEKTLQAEEASPAENAAAKSTRIEVGRGSTTTSSVTVVDRTPQQVSNQRDLPQSSPAHGNGAMADDQTKIDEALRYLLRQLRNSQEKDAA